MQPPTFRSLLVSIFCVISPILALDLEDTHSDLQGTHSAQAVDNWIKRNVDNLPADYETFSQHSQTYRRAIYRTLDNETRGSLWANHLDSYISKHPDLTSEKLAVIQEARDYMASTETDDDRLHKLEERVKETFDEAEGHALFARLGNDDHMHPSRQEPCIGDGEPAKRQLSRRQGDHSLCDCAKYGWWDCAFGGAGCSPFEPCIEPVEETGCGNLYQYKCDGLCLRGEWCPPELPI